MIFYFVLILGFLWLVFGFYLYRLKRALDADNVKNLDKYLNNKKLFLKTRFGHFGYSPLHYSIIFNKSNSFDYLTSNRLFINDKTNLAGKSALHLAVSIGDIPKCLKLIESGADLNCVDDIQNHPIHYAAENGNTVLVQTLKSKGAKVDNVVLISLGDVQAIKENIRNKEKTRFSYLNIAAVNNQPEIIQYLVSLGYCPNELDNYGLTPLINTILKDSYESFLEILKTKVEVNKKDSFGNTALDYSVEENLEVYVSKLIESGAEIRGEFNQ